MLDPYLRKYIDRPLNRIGKQIAALGISANVITLAGFVCGIFAMLMITQHRYGLAIVFIFLNRFADGLDGAVARHSELSEFGGFLDIVCDFIVYSGIVFAFGLAEQNNLLYALFLIFSFVGTITSFLGYAIVASKKNITSEKRGKKSFYHLGGICEGTETTATLFMLCLMPQYFNYICIVFGSLCWMTTIGRIYSAWIDFGSKLNSAKTIPSSIVYNKLAEETESQDP